MVTPKRASIRCLIGTDGINRCWNHSRAMDNSLPFKPGSRGMRWVRRTVLAAVFLVTLRVVPPLWCGRDAGAWWRGATDRQSSLARSVESWVHQPLAPGQFHTGDTTFDGEWLFGTYQMAAIGFAQIAVEHPDLRAHCLHEMELCEDRLNGDRVRRFDWAAWKEDPLEALEGPNGHAAYLGYLNLVLSLHRTLEPGFKHRQLNDRITATLARNLGRSPILLLEYPEGVRQDAGDIDSGPLMLGRSISASGFMLGCARQQGDWETFRMIYRTAHLFGAPTLQGNRRSFAVGGPLGDSLMLALLTAQPVPGRANGGGR